jgi:hypothetical protein
MQTIYYLPLNNTKKFVIEEVLTYASSSLQIVLTTTSATNETTVQ